MINATINGIAVQANEGETILQTAEKYNINIPTMCYIKDLAPEGACRMCMVEIQGQEKLVTACSTPIKDGQVVETESKKVVEARKGVLGLLLSNHPAKCDNCASSGICKLQELCIKYEVDETEYKGAVEKKPVDESNPYINYDPNLCVLCRRCVNVCGKIMKTSAIDVMGKGFGAKVGGAFGVGLADTGCDSCGNCVEACSTGALSFKRQKDYHIWEPQRTVRVTCPGCEDACLMDALVKDWKVIDVKGVADGPREGMLCAKGRFEIMDDVQALVDEKIGFLK